MVQHRIIPCILILMRPRGFSWIPAMTPSPSSIPKERSKKCTLFYRKATLKSNALRRKRQKKKRQKKTVVF